jgi:hypothetical protein
VMTSTPSNFSDHCLVVIILCGSNRSNERVKTEIIRNNYEAIKDELAVVQRELQNDVINNNFTLNECLQVVKNVIDKHKTVTIIKHKKNLNLPRWIDAKIGCLIRNIDNVHEKILRRKKNRLPVDRLVQKLNKLKEKLEKYDNEKAKRYYSTRIVNDRNSSWKLINEMCGRRPEEKKIILRCEDGVKTDYREIANILNNYFINNSTCVEITPQYLGPHMSESMNLVHVSEETVTMHLRNLSLQKAVGSDGIPARIWREIDDEFVATITILINKMIDTQKYPNMLKTARVKPLHKGGDATDKRNYRPISILPIFNKVTERIIYDQIAEHMNELNLFNPLQYGFRKERGTQDAVAKVLSLISRARDKDKIVVALSIDIQKAFDSLNPAVILEKMSRMGMRGNVFNLIKDYLADRRQFVKIGNIESGLQRVESGVPQGSNLGPLLLLS